ncbi:carbohydrate-binding module family 18 protein [Thermothelomyces thermophilus ATCC 42464]|uniref:Carbohydrate-binding module family 18 protein n=1 Tax=Thermothelomyces thermophilus (strain ATCC 42464 / BCRC 31852 / DSM 1799) TaxID=573729 RepID=G2QMR2_THET4|nr:carbohydrate-binding module family 18 protein [Thermothelomyces thermophilus ATCC 42464]AEO61242.1 carbohydrate-binding module family 18 protein [Thermothelomyces thermophilus ATCC 42464]
MRSIYLGLAAAALCWAGALSDPAAAKDEAELAAALVGRHRLSRSNNNGHRFASSNLAELGVRQSTGQCGPEYGRCPGDLCCSEYGFCGDSIDHCHPLFRCQPDYGTCGWPRDPPATSTSSSTPPASSSSSTSTSQQPPSTTSSSTITSIPSSTSTSSGPTPTGPLEVTKDGRCGNNTICVGNPNFGPCCSQFFWCGSSEEYCGAGCQSQFGACMGVPGIPGEPPNNITTSSTTSSSTTATATSTTVTSSSSTTSTSSSPPAFTLPPGQVSSTDGRCGNNVNCLGSQFGRCCSQFGWCGEGDTYCGYIAGCQPNFGYCDPRPT